MTDKVVFHLKRMWEGKDLWEEIKSGRKTSEWRDFSKYWVYRLCHKSRTDHSPAPLVFNIIVSGTESQNLTAWLRVHKAWFVVGYPKNSVPRLEADITGLVYHPSTCQLEIQFANVREVVANICGLPVVIDENEPNWRLEMPGEFKP